MKFSPKQKKNFYNLKTDKQFEYRPDISLILTMTTCRLNFNRVHYGNYRVIKNLNCVIKNFLDSFSMTKGGNFCINFRRVNLALLIENIFLC